jgi:hypothetical protein
MYEDVKTQVLGKAQATYLQIMGSLGADAAALSFFINSWNTLPDRFLQMCIPSVEYPHSGALLGMRFAGGLLKGHRNAYTDPSTWWREFVGKSRRKLCLCPSEPWPRTSRIWLCLNS